MPGVPAQVGYTGTPTVEPSNQPLPSIHEDAPIEAFGGAVAAGLSHLGTAVEGAGNELFTRAYAMQQLDNESNARDADTQYMIEAGKLHAQYNALEGKARVDAYDDYAKNLQDLRTKIRGSLGNPQAQKMYDASSLSTMGRTIFNGAGAAATAQIQYNEATLKGMIDQDAHTVEMTPRDQSLTDEKIQRTRDNVARLTALHGMDENNPATKDAQDKAVSALVSRRILSVAKDQPNIASQMTDEAVAKGQLRDDDLTKVQNKVESYAQTTGVLKVADNVLAAHKQDDGTYDKSFEDMQAEARAKAEAMWPKDTKIGISAEQAFNHTWLYQKSAITQDDQARRQEWTGYIQKGVTESSMLPQSLLNRMKPTEIKQFNNDAAAYHHSQIVKTNEQKYNDLLGMYNNNNTEFMTTNIYQVPGLNKSNIDFFVGLQRKAAANGDPRVTKAMTDIKGFAPAALDALGVTGPRMDRDVHNQFVGALHSAIQGWQEEYGKPPTPKDLQDTIYPSLLRKVSEPGWLWGTNQTEFFKSQVPQPVIDSATKTLGHEPNEVEQEQIRSEYMRTQFNTFYKGSRQKFDQRYSP